MIDPNLGAIGIIALIFGDLFFCMSIYALIRRYRMGRARPFHQDLNTHPVLVVRPCAGRETLLKDNLVSTIRARLPQNVCVVIAVGSEDDPALEIARDAKRTIGEHGVKCQVMVAPPSGPNRKVGILNGVMQKYAGQFDILINADSDVDLTDTDLVALASDLLKNRKVGAVWCPVAELESSKKFSDRSSEAVLAGSVHAFQILAVLDKDCFVGKLFGLRSDVLGNLTAFQSLENYLGEDMELAKRLKGEGKRVTPSFVHAVSRPEHRAFREVVARHARWMAVIRAQRPWLMAVYPLVFMNAPLFALLGAASLQAGDVLGVLGAGLGFAGRIVMALSARHFSKHHLNPIRAFVDIALADLVLWGAYLTAMSSRQVVWRGHKLTLKRDGTLKSVQ